MRLAEALLNPSVVQKLAALAPPQKPILLPVTALEVSGFNAIPDAMANILWVRLGWEISFGDIVQNNRVGHTRAPSFNRLVTPAAFEGRVRNRASYVLVDDHVGLGGTLANLKGYIETSGGRVIAMTTLTQSRDACRIALQPDTLGMLKDVHGEDLESFWNDQFGHSLDCLTNVEAGILCREPSLDAIRNRIAQAKVEVRGKGLIPGSQGG